MSAEFEQLLDEHYEPVWPELPEDWASWAHNNAAGLWEFMYACPKDAPRVTKVSANGNVVTYGHAFRMWVQADSCGVWFNATWPGYDLSDPGFRKVMQRAWHVHDVLRKASDDYYREHPEELEWG